MSILKKLLGRPDSGDVPPPGTPPIRDKHGVITDPGNPWIGPINRKVGYPTEGYSGAQLRIIRRAEGRRLAAEQRVASRQYQRAESARLKYVRFGEQRHRILAGVIQVSPALLANVRADQVRRQAVTAAFSTLAERRKAAADRREDRLDERRIARFKAGKPRGKDLREETFKQYSSFLPASYWLPTADEALSE